MSRGRPKSQIRAAIPEVREFFEECERRSLSITEIQVLLAQQVPRAPSYRALQEWRRGTRSPRFAPFKQWLRIVTRRAR